jgi:hypothetical protein
MSLSSTHTTQPQPLATTPANGEHDPENDEDSELFAFYTELSDAEVPPEDEPEAVIEDSNDVPGTDASVSYDIPPPPVDQFYDTLEDALQSIREFTKEHGYALTGLRFEKGEDGAVNKVYLQCDRGKSRTSRVQKQNRRRFRGTRILDCPFSGILIHSKDIRAWVFETGRG